MASKKLIDSANKKAIKRMDSKSDDGLPSFEMIYRKKTGVNLSVVNKNYRYEKVSDEKRQRKAGGGRKPKVIHNIYFEQIDGSDEIESALDDLTVGAARSFTCQRGKCLFSISAIKNVLRSLEYVSAPIITEAMGYSQTQARRMVEAVQLMVAMNIDLKTGMIKR